MTRDDIVAAVAQGWCSPENANKEMDVVLGEAIVANVETLFAAALEANARLRAALDNSFLAIVEAKSHADPGSLFRVLNELLGEVDTIRRSALRRTP